MITYSRIIRYKHPLNPFYLLFFITFAGELTRMIEGLLKDHLGILEISGLLKEPAGNLLHLKGLSSSSKSVYVHSIITKVKGVHLILLGDKEEAAYFYNDLTSLDGPERTFFFPSSYTRSIQFKKSDEANIISRTQILKRLSERHPSNFIVSYPEAVIEKVISRKGLKENTFEIIEGDKLNREFLRELLDAYSFELVDFVYEPGQYALRGSIIDFFSYSSPLPHRIDFFGDEIESIRTFEIESQLSVNKAHKAILIPNIQWEKERKVQRISIFEFLPENTCLWANDLNLVFKKMDELYSKTEIYDPQDASLVKKEVIIDSNVAQKDIASFNKVEFDTHNYLDSVKNWAFKTSPQPVFNKNFDMLVTDIRKRKEEGFTVFILSENEKQIERLQDIFREIDKNLTFTPYLKTLHEGFIDHDLKVCLYTDHQIFERYHKFQIHDRYNKKESISLKELTGLNPGDYVVHIDHGIGIFGGLEIIEINGKKQESVRLVYKDKDVLYVSIHALHRISKYKGKEGEVLKLYKLGTGAWQKLKQSTKKKVKDIAEELIKLYAIRKQQKGFAFSPDTYLQRELESSFIYEDTPDQLKATTDTKESMEAEFPMDRLICGDVGFGKTEIAIRAAFKAVTDSKQVALLVPTTILAFQHFNTFRDRLKVFPCSIDYISRFRKPAEQKIIREKLEKGEIDIIIGTHKLVGKEIQFKDLGLLIVDEEQKFGVSVKEKLRKLKLNVDTLTLTATPIPRTLQFSLMGARDLSIINTPPPNRHPIFTEIHTFNEEIFKEAIEYEVSRGGQVFVINNRIQNIKEVKEMINRICKGVRTVVAHGQMEGDILEKAMLGFIQGDYDVLVATAIIESGLDIPNANTIIVNNAHQFGLSDLHQLRGRVGRSNKKAFCYLISPPLDVLTPEARRRLKAIEEFAELGSGISIAMQDLDIRGAGNLLGAEQSGFIADIGFETYQRILNEAIQELKENEYKEVFEKPVVRDIDKTYYSNDCQIDTDLELLFPDYYINNVSERIRLYKDLDNITDENDLLLFKENLKDRFGPLPPQTEELLDVVRLRRKAMKLGIEKIIMKNGYLITFFITDPASDYYSSQTFSSLLNFVQIKGRYASMKEENGRLSLKIQGIKSISQANELLDSILN